VRTLLVLLHGKGDTRRTCPR